MRLSMLILIAGAAVWAQNDDKVTSVSKVERKRKAPVSGEVLRVKLPKPVEAVGDNGLQILVMEDHRQPLFSIQMQVFGAGALFDPLDTPGVATLAAQMMREGTKGKNSRQLAEEIEKLGASISASAPYGSDSVTFSVSGLSENMDAILGLAAEILLQPNFPAEELNKLKQRTRVGLMQQRSSPQFLLGERFSQLMFGSHPASVVATTPAALDAITPELLAKWHKERIVPQNAMVGVAGDVDSKDVIGKFKRLHWVWKRTEYKPALPENPKAAESRRIVLVNRPDSVQTSIAMGNLTIDRTHPDYIPLMVMNRVVGDGPAARLFINLREEKGYTYGVYSSVQARRYPGPWRAGGDVRTEVTEGSLTEFFNEITRIRDQEVPESELEECKRSVVAKFALSLEDASDVLAYALTRKQYGLPADYWDTYADQVSRVTAEQVQRVAKRYLNPEAIQLVTVGDASKIRPVLEKYGTVEVFGTDGKPSASTP
ncbi:MAG: insulinase family protein [Acidobacteria bacterium]|nr:insulinase family protein [Acidobacteriota bacterium]